MTKEQRINCDLENILEELEGYSDWYKLEVLEHAKVRVMAMNNNRKQKLN